MLPGQETNQSMGDLDCGDSELLYGHPPSKTSTGRWDWILPNLKSISESSIICCLKSGINWNALFSVSNSAMY